MTTARHPRPPELAGMPLEEIARRYVARFRDRKADWDAFADARIDGYRRAQHRFIGAGGSGKHGRARPETMGYADEALYRERDQHLKES
ncbi:MAG TPA: hypothetical protein VF211_13055 [Burkholderiales bacterium]